MILESLESLVSHRHPGKVNLGGGQSCQRESKSAVVANEAAVKVGQSQKALQLFVRIRKRPGIGS